MDKKKTLKAIWATIIFICLLGFAGAVYSTHIIATLSVVIVAFTHAVISIKNIIK